MDLEYKNAPPGWLYGECQGRSGLFPENYAEKVSVAEMKTGTQEPVKSAASPSDISGSLSVKSLAAALSLQFGTGGGASPANQTQTQGVPSVEIVSVFNYT